MNKGEFVGGMLVVSRSTGQVMTLGGSPDNWACTYVKDGKTVTINVKPEDVDPVD